MTIIFLSSRMELTNGHKMLVDNFACSIIHKKIQSENELEQQIKYNHMKFERGKCVGGGSSNCFALHQN